MREIKYENLDLEFLLQNNNNNFCIYKNNYDFHFKINIKDHNDKLVVFSNGAADRKRSELPLFMRHTWSEEINANCLYIDDRTIHDSKLMIGWGIGREDSHFLREVSLIVQKITQLLEIKSDSTFYYGSSAGGFMSMILSIKHRYSKAIINNPQLILKNYIDGKPLSFIRNNFFKQYSQEEFIKKFPDRISIPYLMNAQNYVPRVLYIFNRESLEDYEKQYLPFLEELSDYNIDQSKIEYLIYHHKSLGHNPLPKERTIKIINSALEKVFL
jgi:hypothetical protein